MVYNMYRSWYSWYMYTIASNVIEYEIRTRWGMSVSLDRAMSLAEASANKHLCSMQLYVNIVHFSRAHVSRLKTCSTWTLGSAYNWWLQNCKLGMGKWNCCACESARSYEGRLNVDLAHFIFRFMIAALGATFIWVNRFTQPNACANQCIQNMEISFFITPHNLR